MFIKAELSEGICLSLNFLSWENFIYRVCTQASWNELFVGTQEHKHHFDIKIYRSEKQLFSLTHVWDVSDPCLICLRPMFDMSQTHVWYVSDSCLINLRLMFEMSQTHVWPRFNMSLSHVCYVTDSYGQVSESFSLCLNTSHIHLWWVSDLYLICHTQVWYVSNMFDMFQAHVWNVSDSCSKWDSCLIWLRLMFHISQHHVQYILNSCFMCLRLTFGKSRTHVR